MACPDRQATSDRSHFNDGIFRFVLRGVHAAIFCYFLLSAMVVTVVTAGKLTDHSCYTGLDPATATSMEPVTKASR